MSWQSHAPQSRPTGQLLAPLVLGPRKAELEPFISTIDDTSSDCRTLDLLSALLVALDPAVIAEVGTYRGIGTVVMAETLRLFDLHGHIWTCDPTDYDTRELFQQVGVQSRVTYVPGTFEDLLQEASPMDFCYIDASDPNEGSMRLRYTLLALECMRPGGLIVVDDAKGDWPGAASVRRLGQRHGLYLPQRRGVVVLQA